MTDHPVAGGPSVDRVEIVACTVPTDTPESDGTFAWDSTTIVIAIAYAGGEHGIGYTYAPRAAAMFATDMLVPVVCGHDTFAVRPAHDAMLRATRNAIRPGIATEAVSAIDAALWDLKARLLGLPLVDLIGRTRDAVEAYGSGGFTSYSVDELRTQLGGWAAAGFRSMKMKVGRAPDDDPARVREAKDAIGDAQLFVDANGAYVPKQALALARRFATCDVRWFEEPVSSDDLDGLRFIRERVPPGMEIAAGEYAYDVGMLRRMARSGAVDVLQADATRCGGITGFLDADALCRSLGIPLSAHTAPSVHLHPACAASAVRHIEYFHDHARLERMLFDGTIDPVGGLLSPDLTRPGNGLRLKRRDAERHCVYAG